MDFNLTDRYHLYNRTSFFVHHSDMDLKGSRERVVDKLIELQVKSELKIDLPDPYEYEASLKNKSEKKKRVAREKLRQDSKLLNMMWVNQMAEDDKGFLEKMTLFWHGHFACRTIQNPYLTMEMNNLLRNNALGSFRDLLYAVSKSASMINYLHLKQNKKASPNEDFGRELCELFTLGHDVDYTEKDVAEIARAFTGWTFHKGKHLVNPRQHDIHDKTIFGKTGNFGGEDVLEMILDNPKCAYHIAKKVYRFFVQDSIVENEVREIADALYKSNYDISAMMKAVFMADWFYEYKGKMIKSPVEFLVGYCKMFDIKMTDVKSTMGLQHYLGQILFEPPNVAGWAGGRQWIDSSRLAFRMRLGSLIVNRGYIMDELSPELDQMLMNQSKRREIKFYHDVDWDLFWKRNEGANIYDVLIRTENPGLKYAESTNEKVTIIHLISTPDFQLI